MITELDLEQAIEEITSSESVSMRSVEKLSALFTVRNNLYGNDKEMRAKHIEDQTLQDSYISISGDSNFLKMVVGMPASVAWGIMNELMEAVQVLQPKLYQLTMRKIMEKSDS